VGGIVSPRREQPVAALVDDEGGEVGVLATVFQAVLTVQEDVDEIVAAVIAPGCRPLACAAGVVVGVLATSAIAAFEIACRVDNKTGVANSVTHGLCCAIRRATFSQPPMAPAEGQAPRRPLQNLSKATAKPSRRRAEAKLSQAGRARSAAPAKLLRHRIWRTLTVNSEFAWKWSA
jgi:hypothetical protein